MGSESDRGLSSVVGVVLLLGITIIGTGVVVGLGSQAFADAERGATVSQAGHSLTQFDSKAAIVALGRVAPSASIWAPQATASSSPTQTRGGSGSSTTTRLAPATTRRSTTPPSGR
ncbi:archaellin/type IV pilin N-terminal domain-containing protein [Halolamina pelagica]|uniref:archaellin/type IV pilin N-terminal domain-containing protein n=1 Tax=Halolamina pelagica TaxID=699431 RepID=UPI00166F703E|nr:archaellin/type IV pilin N-terminal domain-containing protein [Halolamina pelagica]